MKINSSTFRKILLSTVVCGLATYTARPGECGDTPPRPHVLFIAIDDLRPALGCYGDALARTPNIDALASRARQFNRAYCQQAVCGPSRASLLTGRLPDATRVWHNRNRFRVALPENVTLPELFKNHGYHTQSFGKIFSGDPREEDPQSWSVPAILRGKGWRNYALTESRSNRKKGVATENAVVNDDRYPDGKITELAVETLEEIAGRQDRQPFFLAVGYFKPHLPFSAPRKYWERHDPREFVLGDQTERVKLAPKLAYHGHRELGGYTDIPPNEVVSPKQASHLRHGYYACVSYIDAQVGRLLAALKRLGLEDDTIVVVWGDHGFALGEGDRWCKGTNFELDTRVPLIIRTPQMQHPGESTEALTELVDLYPTLAELAGLKSPQQLDGRSLVPILKDPTIQGRNVTLSQFARPFERESPQQMGYSLRTATHRYTRWIQWDTRETIVEELYAYLHLDASSFPSNSLLEEQNLVSDPEAASIRDQLRRMMDELLAQRSPKFQGRKPPSTNTK